MKSWSTVALLVIAVGEVGCSGPIGGTAGRQWEERVAAAYDEAALTAFLKRVIAECPECGGVKLTRSNVGNTWTLVRRGTERGGPSTALQSGDWCFSADNVDQKSFRFTWDYDYPGVVIVTAKRISRSEYELQSVELDEWLIP